MNLYTTDYKKTTTQKLARRGSWNGGK